MNDMNPMNHGVLRVLRTSAFALAALAGMAAFAGSDTDPVIGSYEGTAYLKLSATIDGIGGIFVEQSDSQPIEIEFATGNVVTINELVGTWKKKGSKYLADTSEALTAQLATDFSDPDAKGSAKYKKIALEPGVGITGKVNIKRAYRSDLVLIHFSDKGVFGAPIAP